MRINCLEPKIFNKIAAGEVVERPASIVKELVENSIDAGATMVTIKIENGGISKINITDDGCGIHFDDLKTAFLPHATSKIKSEDDLFGIKTLGFRGEALASIAAVSEIALYSKERGADNGGKIEISGGTIVTAPEIAGCPDGTDITVSNLFFNVPARAKFLKKPKTEEGEITSLVSKFILANPMVSFKYIVDGKIKYLSSGKGIKDALFVVHGKEAVENTVELDADYGYIKIYGYIGTPAISKPNRTYQTIIINNRVIENITISSAIQNAYGEMLMKKQFPLFVLYIDLDYSQIDVNVHPNKKEVRFENNSDIYLKVFEVVNRRLNNLDLTRTIQTEEEEKPFAPSQNFVYSAPNEVSLTPAASSAPKSSHSYSGYDSSSSSGSTKTGRIIDYDRVNDDLNVGASKEEIKRTTNIINAMSFLSDEGDAFTDGVRVGSRLLQELTRKMDNDEQLSIDSNIHKPQIKLLGTLFNTYIVIEQGETVYFIDQHAGHERLLFDRLIKQVKKQDVEIQSLLVPYILTLNPQEQDYIEQIRPNLESLGFFIEEFGAKTYRVESVPYVLSSVNLKEFFDNILSDIKSLQIIELTDLLRDKLASLACKSAVKGGDELATDEIEKLLNQFAEGGNRLLCPHGRPIVVALPQKEIEKWFKRIV